MVSLLTAHCCRAQQNSADQLLKKARDHLNLFQYDQALALLNQATQIAPENWEAWFLAGKSFMKQKKEIQAEKYLQKALELNPEELEVQKALGALYIFFAKDSQGKGKTEEMTDFLHKACKAYPGGTKIWMSLMDNWWKAEEYEKIKREGDLLLTSNKTVLEQGDDKSLQSAIITVAKAYYRDNDLANTEKFLKSASMIRHHNDDLFNLRREMKSRAEDSIKKLVDEANQAFNQGNYDKALELLATAGKTPGSKSSEISEMMEKIEKESGLLKTIGQADSLIAAEKYEEALEKLEEASANYPEEERITGKLEQARARVDKIRAEETKKRNALMAEKKKQLDKQQQFDFFVKEVQEHEKANSFDMAIISAEKAAALFPEHDGIKKTLENLHKKASELKARRDAFAVAQADLENLFSAENFSECYTHGQRMLADYNENDYVKKIATIHAETCLILGKNQEAREMLQRIKEDKDLQKLYNYIQGMLAYNEGNRDDALASLKKLAAVDSSFRPGINSTVFLIYLYKFQIGIYLTLLCLLFPAIKIARSYLVNFRTARMLQKIEAIKESGAYEANLAFLEERFAKEDTPNPKQIGIMLAEALLRSGNVQRAYEISSGLLKKDSRNANARRIAGEACLQLQDTSPSGMDYIQGLLKLDGPRKPVIMFLAQTYMQSKADHKMAQDFILEAISLNPGDTDAILYLADTYIKRQSYSSQSVKIFEKAIKAAPEAAEYYQGIIENFRRIDNHQEAQKWLETARERFPDTAAFSDQPKTTGLKMSGRSYGNLPVYDSIGVSETSEIAPAQTHGAFPDYESIGNDPAESDSSDMSPDYNNLIAESLPPEKMSAPAAPPIQGPIKNCPHCGAVNSAKEYYCTSCGKAFGG
jgi:tetratricopeptide (TPR) repeat protein